NLVLGQLTPRLGFLLAQVSVFLFGVFIWQGSGLPWYGAAYFMLGGYRAARALASAQVRSFVETHQLGLAYGIVETLNSLPLVLAPPIAGWLYDLHPTLVYPIALVCIGLTLLLSLRFLPRPVVESLPALSD
ncbi:MAG: hypothetical protein ACUVRJ_03350, partial [Candidatus Villigracilaceae bacterium]